MFFDCTHPIPEKRKERKERREKKKRKGRKGKKISFGLVCLVWFGLVWFGFLVWFCDFCKLC